MNNTETQPPRPQPWTGARRHRQVTAELAVKPAQGLSAAEAAARLARFGPNELVERGGKKPWQTPAGPVHQQARAHPDRRRRGLGHRRRLQGRDRHPRHRDPQRRARLRPGVPGGAGHGRARRSWPCRTCGCAATARSRTSPRATSCPATSCCSRRATSFPADGRLVEAANLRIQEALLTGESEPVEKITRRSRRLAAATALGDRRNMAFMGTTVTYGRGVAARSRPRA